VSVVNVKPDDAHQRLELSRTRLLRAAPDLSASRLLRNRQRTVLLALLVVVVVALVVAPLGTLIVAVAACVAVYLATVTHRLTVTVLSGRAGSVVTISDEEARAIADEDLPIYTVLVPAYREPEVIDTLLHHLGALDYPAERLDLKLLLEADDTETVERALRHPLADSVDIVLVPPGEPRTKPKALNYGLTLARGELVTIYDAEDQPDPLQLRRAAAAFADAPDDLACLQAQLTYRNPDQNLITRWFTIEYLMWFSLFLPGLAATDAPIPLGGTSNHIRRRALEGLGGWDPYNVTEDADLGVRLHRVGWRCGVLGSVTYEEANSDFVNWMKQRSRWYKGYLQTWLVHLRRPVRLWRELGPSGFAQFNLFVGGTPLLALLNPVFWGLTTLWFLGHFGLIQDLFPAPVYYAGLVSWAVGNLSVLYLNVLTARKAERPSLVVASLLVPVYWLMMSMAAIKAAVQLVFQPTYWEKTTHGLDGPAATGAAPDPRAVGSGTVVEAGALADGPIGDGAPALAVAEARSATTAAHLVGAARLLRTVGVALIALVLWLVAGTALVARHGASDRAAAAAAPAADAVARPGAGDPVARLTVRRTGFAVTVLEGTGDRSLDRGAGHAPSSSLLGGTGNAVVVGHRRLADGPLRGLDGLRIGDEVRAVTPWGGARYQVIAVGEVPAGRVDLAPEGRDRLTMVTDGGGSSVLQVRARLLGSPIERLPAPRAGYPTLPGPRAGTALAAGAWALLAGVAWRARGALGRRRGVRLAGAIAAPVVALCLLEAAIAAGHALPGLT
jgi:cellulose synthase/poly-beta-1,6-N-acetylglucosamine synthase-like glycosyltransferase